MTYRRLGRVVTVILFLSCWLCGSRGRTEPWLSERFSQNCAACHSPDRRNVIPSQRRCTLSCQGCHVSPFGGGLRNSYGMWNEDRWLRSFKSNYFRNKGTPAPVQYQAYGHEPIHLNRYNVIQRRRGRPPLNYLQMARHGAPLVVLPGVKYNPVDYKDNARQEDITVRNRAEFMARVTDDDPYRIEHTQKVFAGFEARYFYLNGKFYDQGKLSHLTYTGPMSMDFGVRYRPVPDHVQLVLEQRDYNALVPNSTGSSVEHFVTGGGTPRSAYVMVDDLPYNTYVMYGLYKPMFGYQNPDHTSLLNTLMFADNSVVAGKTVDAFDEDNNRSATALYKAISIGGSPNVPFFNVSYIMPINSGVPDGPFYGEKGIAATVGGRFVTDGASIMFSYWNTKGAHYTNGPALDNEMYGVTAGFDFHDLITNVDFSTIHREFSPGAYDTGSVQTFDFKYRVWREFYAEANFAYSNVARNLKAGSSTEYDYGVRSFLYPGVDCELLVSSRDDKDSVNDLETRLLMTEAQLHLYF